MADTISSAAPVILPRRVPNLVGAKYNRMTVLAFAGMKNHKSQWLCRCDCGAEKVAQAMELKSGHTKSCGCKRIDNGRSRSIAGRDTQEYRIWLSIRSRCANPNATGYRLYGGRGIAVSPEWQTFERFYEDMGPRPGPKYQIDRIDNNGDYGPGNCRWVTRQVNMRNTRRNRFVTFAGQTKTLAEWSELFGINAETLRTRIVSGWPVDQALTLPVVQGQKRPK